MVTLNPNPNPNPNQAFEMLLVSRSSAWHVATPLLPFSRPPVGVGDLTSRLFPTLALTGTLTLTLPLNRWVT